MEKIGWTDRVRNEEILVSHTHTHTHTHTLTHTLTHTHTHTHTHTKYLSDQVRMLFTNR